MSFAKRCTLVAVLTGSITLCSFATQAATLTVYAAVSTKDALDAVAAEFTKATKIETRRVYAASNALAQQIANGAPAAIFISADEAWMDFIEQRGLVAPGSRRALLGNEMVGIVPVSSLINTLDLSSLPQINKALDGKRLALANPDSVPAGRYAKAALTKLGSWPALESRLARTENVRAALTFVARGEAPLGIVYRSDALSEKSVKVVATIPSSAHPPIRFPMAIVKNSDSTETRRFAQFLSDPAQAALWRKHGFELLSSKATP